MGGTGGVGGSVTPLSLLLLLPPPYYYLCSLCPVSGICVRISRLVSVSGSVSEAVVVVSVGHLVFLLGH